MRPEGALFRGKAGPLHGFLDLPGEPVQAGDRLHTRPEYPGTPGVGKEAEARYLNRVGPERAEALQDLRYFLCLRVGNLPRNLSVRWIPSGRVHFASGETVRKEACFLRSSERIVSGKSIAIKARIDGRPLSPLGWRIHRFVMYAISPSRRRIHHKSMYAPPRTRRMMSSRGGYPLC